MRLAYSYKLNDHMLAVNIAVVQKIGTGTISAY